MKTHPFLRDFSASQAIRFPQQSERGAALVIVLAFVVLLTGLVMAFTRGIRSWASFRVKTWVMRPSGAPS